MNPLLELQNISFSYHEGKPVLKDINLSIRYGEKLAIVGENGSGKTTLFNLIVRILEPDEGKIIFMGKTINSKKGIAFLREKVGFLFQDPEDQLFCPTLLEDVAFGPLNLGFSTSQAREKAMDTLELVGLKDLAGLPPYMLSEGQKRMGALAAVLAMDPDLLLLDEPTSGLDERAQARLEQILLETGKAVLVASHDKPFLAKCTSKSYILSNGHLLLC
ncbi:ABC transporter ATP-binding protein [Thermovirga sp.]|uniref:energy-coupling factor ABC transporter ATP-binding protein n=1 Tax=Thermovirga sp. TaxID=2699834 RepID=UPI0025CEB5CB|nr:ABC transporter ATP-binding protein [Thermovirga sp.]MBO8154056.1 ABC transporter ATP-binding protein [Thermovirga sp.]